MAESLGHKAIKGTIWASVDKFGLMGLQFVVNLVLARLLTPEDFGAVGVLTIFIVVSQTLIDGGFGSALIQKKVPTQDHYSTIFWWNLVFAVILYGILFLVAPFIADFFRMEILCSVLRVIGLVLVFNALCVIQNNRLRKQLAFTKLAVANLSSYILGGLVGIFAAFHGWGVWSLVSMQLTYISMQSFILWIITRWRPSMVFSLQYFKELFGFGGYLLAAGLLQEICKNFQGIIIGRKFSPAQMGYYSQAQKLDTVSSSSLSGIIVQVMFPVYSSIQDNDERLQAMLVMNLRVISLIVFPLLGLLILCAEPLICGLYGAKWQPSVSYFQILCCGGMFVCLQNINFYAVASKGKSRSLFLWSFYKWGGLLALLFIGMNFGMTGLMWAMVISSVNIWIVNALLAQKHIGLRFARQIIVLLPVFFTVLFSLGLVEALYLLNYIHNTWFLAGIYMGVVCCVPLMFHFHSLTELRQLVGRLLKR